MKGRNTRKTVSSIAVLAVSLVLGVSDLGHAQAKDQLGKVDPQNSCSPAAQESFQRSVASRWWVSG